MPSFWKGEGSRNSHEMRQSGMPGMDLLISPSLQTYTANEPNESIKINRLNTNDEMRNYLLSYDVLILEASFHDV